MCSNELKDGFTHLLNTSCNNKKEKTFNGLVKGFEEKYNALRHKGNTLALKKYFGAGSGVVTARNSLIASNEPYSKWLWSENEGEPNAEPAHDFKGLYAFFTKHDVPFYVGISKGVINRVNQHLKGNSHNTASLAYKIAVSLQKSKEATSTRGDFDFKKHAKPVQRFLLEQKLAWIRIDDDNELYLFEVYCALKMDAVFNSFETH